MNYYTIGSHKRRYAVLAGAIGLWLSGTCAFAADVLRGGDNTVTTSEVIVEANRAKEAAKEESQATTIITAEDIAAKQAKSVEEIIFNETGVTRTVDAMGRVGVSIRGAEPRHTLILIDGRQVMGDVGKYNGAGDELQRLGTENVERIEIIRGSASAKYGTDAIGGVINVITRKPKDTAGLQFNVEGRRVSGDGDLFPYQNVFLRADSGEVGKWKFAAYASKRDIMPVWNHKPTMGSSMASDSMKLTTRDSLRYYGAIKNTGISATYDINDRNTIDINVDKISEDLKRSLASGMSQYNRKVDRNSYNLSYKGNNGGNTDWKVDVDYTKLTGDDVSFLHAEKGSQYQGTDVLSSVDNIMHKQWNFKASANTQVNSRHLLTYGFGYSEESAEGSRIRNAPSSYTRKINPWDYDKNLYSQGGKGDPASQVYDYALDIDENGVPFYNQDMEYYGDANNNLAKPDYTYEEFVSDYKKYGTYNLAKTDAPQERKDRWESFASKLREQNPKWPAYGISSNEMMVMLYYNPGSFYQQFMGEEVTYNGAYFKQNAVDRPNRQTIGKAKIKKQHIYLQDLWQINDTTTVAPILRLDHSDMFGTNATFNVGMTHHLGGKANRRLKANIGTGYTEPGIGELYYSWEMYAGMPVGDGVSRLGYWFAGNPYLKPEKSVNFDIGFEGESGKTSTRLDVFHNRIKDYLSVYFTGNLLDFHPGDTMSGWIQPADMIYSFKNIGRAEVTGVEAEINQKFNDHWSARLGYTYLHAINKSDPLMPRQLLDRPQHKVDIGLTYTDKPHGWRVSLWGNYYIHMLDSNTVANNGNYGDYVGDEPVYNFAEGGKQTYEKKTFGIWNFLVQKELSDDATVYFGVDNIFNHHDDDRALQERVYKMGLNMKFGPGKTQPEEAAVRKVTADAAKAAGVKGDNNWFIQAPFDTEKEQGAEIIGDYRARWNAFTGKEKSSELRKTMVTNIGTAEKNIMEKSGHAFEQRVRLGVDARIGENTNVTVLGSASGMSGVDTAYDKSDSKGLNHQRLENIDVTQHANKWDFSVGRLTEPMGVTGYWFGKEYDGARAVWTSGKNQVRLGYGDFSASTGITDSAYTHATHQKFYRGVTKNEWVGSTYIDTILDTGYEGLAQRLIKTTTVAEQKKIIDEALEVIKNNDTTNVVAGGSSKTFYQSMIDSKRTIGMQPYMWKRVQKVNKNGVVTSDKIIGVNMTIGKTGDTLTLAESLDEEVLTAKGNEYWDKYVGYEQEYIDAGEVGISRTSKAGTTTTTWFYGYGYYAGDSDFSFTGSQNSMDTETFAKDFVSLSEEEAKKLAIESAWSTRDINGNIKLPNTVAQLTYSMWASWQPEDNSQMPLHLLEELGYVMEVEGTSLNQDYIPSIERAAYAQYKHQFGNHFGMQAWYLRSLGDDTHSFQSANGDTNDTASFDQLANVIGLGATYRVSDMVRFSYEWGQNRTDFGRYMNGHTAYNDAATIGDMDYFAGHEKGGTPRFWVARVDVGHSDMDVPGSWNMFLDYKYFDHGSFFGGNGTEGVPDRYLDGIKSFTFGAGYVPAKDFLIEGFYTFGAKGINQRDTLYGPEHFTLGDYTRVQLTYRF